MCRFTRNPDSSSPAACRSLKLSAAVLLEPEQLREDFQIVPHVRAEGELPRKAKSVPHATTTAPKEASITTTLSDQACRESAACNTRSRLSSRRRHSMVLPKLRKQLELMRSL